MTAQGGEVRKDLDLRGVVEGQHDEGGMIVLTEGRTSKVVFQERIRGRGGVAAGVWRMLWLCGGANQGIYCFCITWTMK